MTGRPNPSSPILAGFGMNTGIPRIECRGEDSNLWQVAEPHLFAGDPQLASSPIRRSGKHQEARGH